MAPEPVKTFSVGFEDREFNEFQYSRLVAKTLGTDHHELVLEPVRFADFFSKFVWFQDEPLADPAGIPLYFISKWAREKVTVVLSGEGADEVFAGYPKYNDAWRQIAMGQIYADMFPQYIRRRIFEPLFGRIPGMDSYVKKYSRLADAPSDYYLLFSLIFSEFQKQRLYTREMAAAVDEEKTASIFRDLYHKPRGADPLQRMLYVDWKTWLPEDLLMKADKMTMATSLELRVPFLDHIFVQFAASLPSICKLRNGTPKHILKELARPILPKEIVDRPKVGFPVPIRPWFRSELKTFAREILCDGQTAARGFFDPAAVDRLLKEHEQYHADHSHKIFNLLCFEQWCRLYLDTSQPPR
jgi:asparagine synthase (glutamine-hydrolysing)